MESWVSTYAERMKPKDAWLERTARRREEWAGKAQQRSNQAYEKSIKIGERMEIGQPILVDHHGDKRHQRGQAGDSTRRPDRVRGADSVAAKQPVLSDAARPRVARTCGSITKRRRIPD